LNKKRRKPVKLKGSNGTYYLINECNIVCLNGRLNRFRIKYDVDWAGRRWIKRIHTRDPEHKEIYNNAKLIGKYKGDWERYLRHALLPEIEKHIENEIKYF